VIDADPIAATVRALMLARTEWTGTASDPLGGLAEVARVSPNRRLGPIALGRWRA
jgi:sirohydrochlorin ferrochelatase